MIDKTKIKEVRIGNVKIGGNNPVLIQSMTNTKTTDIDETVKQILELERYGCEIVRVAVPSEESAKGLKKIKEKIHIPLVADIHFDYRLAVISCEYADKIRINPGNIGSKANISKIINAAKKYNTTIRIGVNLGSLQKDIEKKFGRTAEAMVESAMEYIKFFENEGFENLVISLKASDVMTTIKANRLFREKSNYPLHIGITEAGTKTQGTIKSSVGLGALLCDGIGETIRVSLTASPVEEIPVCKMILSSLNLRDSGRIIISCPTCARTHGDLIKIATEIEEKTAHIEKKIKIAVMGCEVNGPGEALDADIGIALSETLAYLFKNGKIIKKIPKESAVEEILKNI